MPTQDEGGKLGQINKDRQRLCVKGNHKNVAIIIMIALKDSVVCTSRTTHWALITCNMSCAMWYEGTVQLLSLTEFKITFILALFMGWNHKTMKEGRKLGENPWRWATCSRCKLGQAANEKQAFRRDLQWYHSKQASVHNHLTSLIKLMYCFLSFFVFWVFFFFFLHGLPDHRCVHKCVHILLMNSFKLHSLMCAWMCVRAFLLWVVHCMFVHFSSRIQGKAHHKLLLS